MDNKPVTDMKSSRGALLVGLAINAAIVALAVFGALGYGAALTLCYAMVLFSVVVNPLMFVGVVVMRKRVVRPGWARATSILSDMALVVAMATTKSIPWTVAALWGLAFMGWVYAANQDDDELLRDAGR